MAKFGIDVFHERTIRTCNVRTYGAYVRTLEEIIQILNNREPECFVEKTYIMNMSFCYLNFFICTYDMVWMNLQWRRSTELIVAQDAAPPKWLLNSQVLSLKEWMPVSASIKSSVVAIRGQRMHTTSHSTYITSAFSYRIATYRGPNFDTKCSDSLGWT